MLIKDLPKVPRPARNGDWNFYDCVEYAEKMYDLMPQIKEAIKTANQSKTREKSV